MSTTTSLKLPDALKTAIAKVAVFEGKRRKSETALEAFQAYFPKADATMTQAARDLTDEDVVRMVKESRRAICQGGRPDRPQAFARNSEL